ncbi:DUF2252 domain-containing protein [Terriglobus aquaticus]|uniref:DUF2252 domain-containing protein n=1 Tax=Terriglobus aquaticus TaxID=940139 RepID=A0ABW9KN50_9BACT|nr:DUF2252 domain-containing protein [Terriglobus aquaticus]
MASLTQAERRSVGVLARKHCSRSDLGDLDAKRCASDPLQVLSASMHGRIASLIPLKYQRMAASPFGFFRGAASIMAADLAAHPHTGLVTQLCGDAHVANLGAFAAQDGGLVFDLNDFDETIQGPFEWDVKRFATSLLLAGRETGLDREARQASVDTFTQSYSTAMQQFATMPVVELARFQIRRLAHLAPIPAIFRIAQRSTPQRLLDKLTAQPATPGGARHLLHQPPLQQAVTELERDGILAGLEHYGATLQSERRHFFAQYRPVDVVLRVVGTGSVGLRCYVVYMEGSSRRPGSDPLFLQVKEEPASAYAAYLPRSASGTPHQGERVVDGQRLMQLVSDPFLGYTTVHGRDYLVRQFNDHKASLDLSSITPAMLQGYASLCGEILARGHARGGDPAAISAYIGSNGRFSKSILRFAESYARKTRQDWKALRQKMKQQGIPLVEADTTSSKSKKASATSAKASKR